MSTAMRFRSALNGFHREDVVNYIEYVNNRHSAERNQLTAEIERLQAQLSQARVPCEAPESPNAELARQLEEQKALNAELKRQLEEKPVPTAEADARELAQLRRRCAALEEELQRERDQARSRSVEQELEAYRRAERTERVARERAEQVYLQANAAITGAGGKVDEAFGLISDLSDQVSAQLAQLQSAINGSRQALADASGVLNTIRPGNEIR